MQKSREENLQKKNALMDGCPPLNRAPPGDSRNWQDLPSDILFDIANRLTVVDDYASFGRVCASWEKIYQEIFSNIFNNNIFLLIAPLEEVEDGFYHPQRALYNVSNKMVYDLRTKWPQTKTCCGSSFGWLVTVSIGRVNKYNVRLQNPFLGRGINLPPLDSIARKLPYRWDVNGIRCCNFSCKMVLSADPSSTDNYTAVARLGQRGLAFYKSGSASWTLGLDSMRDLNQYGFSDIIYFHKAKTFYALGDNGSVFAINFHGKKPKHVLIAPRLPPPPGTYGVYRYLLEDFSSGDLFQVCKEVYSAGSDTNITDDKEEQQEEEEDDEKSIDEEKTYTMNSVSIGCQLVDFTVFKFKPTTKNWIQMDNLGDKVLFLGKYCSIMRSASDCPGYEPNRIYLIQGTYNSGRRIIEPYNAAKPTRVMNSIWLEPTLKT